MSSCFRPVNVVGWKRAICLEFMDKVRFSTSTFSFVMSVTVIHAIILFNAAHCFEIDMNLFKV